MVRRVKSQSELFMNGPRGISQIRQLPRKNSSEIMRPKAKSLNSIVRGDSLGNDTFSYLKIFLILENWQRNSRARYRVIDLTKSCFTLMANFLQRDRSGQPGIISINIYSKLSSPLFDALKVITFGTNMFISSRVN